MTESQKQQIISFRRQGIGYLKIAQELGISQNTVEGQMAIALRKLREELRHCMPLLLLFGI